MTATITFAGRISGIGHFNRNSGYRRLILAERSQLPERPTSQSCPLRLPNLYPLGDSAQVLKSDTATGAFGRLNDLLRNTMIHVSGKTRFLARQLAKATARRLRLFLLKFGPQPTLPVPHRLDRLAAVMFTVGVAGNVRDTKIHAKEIVRIAGIWFLHIACGRQKPIATMKQEVGLTLSGCKLPQLPISSRECDFNATGQSPERDGLLIDVPCQVPVIEREASKRFKSALRFLVELICICDLRSAADGYLGRDSKDLSQFPVREFLECILAERVLLPRLIAQPVACLVRRAQELIERFTLLVAWQQFNFCGKLQKPVYSSIDRKTKRAKSSPPQGGGIDLRSVT